MTYQDHPDVGRRVRALHFGPGAVDDNQTVPPGTLGTVVFVDDAGTRHVDWDNGRHIGLLPGHDTWVTVEPSPPGSGLPGLARDVRESR